MASQLPPPRPYQGRMSPRTRSWIAVGVIAGVFVAGALLLVFLLRDIDWSLFQKTGPLYLALILSLLVLGTASYSTAIYLLVRASGHRTTFIQAYLVLTASLSANYVTPIKAGIPLRIYLYNHFMNIPAAVGTALVAVETLIGMLLPTLVAFLGIASTFTDVGLTIPLVMLAVLLSGSIFFLFFKPERAEPLLDRLPLRGLTRRVARFFGHVQAGLHRVPTWALVSTSVLFSLNFAISAVQLHLVSRILGYPVDPLALFYAIAISVTTGNLSMIPMGLGVRDVSLTLLLVRLDLPNEIALSAAVIQRIFTPGWPLLLGLISTNILGVSEVLKGSETVALPQEDAHPDRSD